MLWAFEQLGLESDVCERLHQRLLPVLAHLLPEKANQTFVKLWEDLNIEANEEQLGHLVIPKP